MANTYTWDCKTVDTYPTHDSHSDVVYNVHWRLNAESDQQDAENNNYSASVYGTHSVNADDISNFIPFADLTNDVVTGWVTSGMGDEEVANLKSVLDSNIDGQINPTSVTKTIG
tara:strand:- start:9544 stop:9885 length:342 start_codon:yes stop_codon:yes gene_type:complete